MTKILRLFADILKQLLMNNRQLRKMEERIMANQADVIARVAVLTTTVSAVSGGIDHLKALIQSLKDQITAGPDTQPIIDLIDAEIARLSALAADANAQS